MPKLPVAVVALCLVGFAAAETPRPAAGPQPRGERWLGIGVTDPKDGDYAKAFDEARRVGMRHVVLSFDWRDLETKPGEFRPEMDFLQIANAWYPPRKTPVHLMIRPIHTNQDVRPAHLKGLAFDDPKVVAAFKALLDWAFTRIPDLDVPSLSIGSEIDGWLGEDAARWNQYTAFVKETAAHARKLRPGLRIACEAMFAGLSRKSAPLLKALNAHCDVLGVSHYPINDASEVLPPSSIRDAFQAACDFAGDKPVFFYQLGYPSGAACKSTEEKQAQFVREVFAAWDTRAKAVPFLNLTWMDDIPASAVEGYTKYYQFDGKGFREFLGTLGMRHEGGKPKAAWGALAQETGKRGW
ncbi:MAG: hypothetical protein HYY18_06335 [Planctomycetes bacterium]|nr:hypothetical protein [Planctomycetota bacterium]